MSKNTTASIIGYGVSTLLLLFLNRRSRSSDDSTESEQQPSKFTEDSGSQIGNCIPVVLGRAMLKNPLISYYGDFAYKPYTEEYGMHSDVDAVDKWWPIILGAIITVVIGGFSTAAIVAGIIMLLSAMMQDLFNDHEGRTTIQKGFKYYLGWQNILCWTGDNFGLKKIWMNVYDSDIEASTELGVWDNEGHIAWKYDNPTYRLKILIDDEDMFGGPDEQGGFVGNIWFYYGHPDQPFSGWMQRQMRESENVPEELKGLTPKYPMFVTCVINGDGSDDNNDDDDDGSGNYNLNIVVFGSDWSAYEEESWIPYWEDYISLASGGMGRYFSTRDASQVGSEAKWVNHYNVTNLSAGGASSSQVLDKLRDYNFNEHPSYCIFEINYYYSYKSSESVDLVKSNIAEMCEICVSHDTVPMFILSNRVYWYNPSSDGRYIGEWEELYEYRIGDAVTYGDGAWLCNHSAEFAGYYAPPGLSWTYLIDSAFYIEHYNAGNFYGNDISSYVASLDYYDRILDSDTRDWFTRWGRTHNFKALNNLNAYNTVGGAEFLYHFPEDMYMRPMTYYEYYNLGADDAMALKWFNGGLYPRPKGSGYGSGDGTSSSDGDARGGAYIGKQATVPEMWFEVVNYPSTLHDNCQEDLKRLFSDKVAWLYNLAVATASIEGVPEDAQDEAQAVVDAANNFDVNNLVPAKQAVDNLLNALNPDLDLYNRINDLKDLLDHGVWTLGRIGDDCNPAEVICEILLNTYWGCNYDVNEDIVDVDSLLMLGATCEEEGLGISCLINNTEEAYTYVDKILSHINGVKYDDPVTGKLTFKLIRHDFNVEELKKFDTTNCESLEYTRLDWSETTSAVSVNFTLADNKYIDAQLVVHDYANTIITGKQTEVSVDGEYFTVAKNARMMALTQLRNAAYPLAGVNFICNRFGYDISIGEPIIVNWEPYGITKVVFRVTDVDYGTLTDGRISITAIEDVYGFEDTTYEFATSPVWTDPEEEPQDVTNHLYVEAPYEIAKDLHTYVYAFASQPSLETIQWYVWRNDEITANYVRGATSTTWCMMGRMVYGIAEKYDDNDLEGFEITYVPNNSNQALKDKMTTIMLNPYVYTNTSGLNLLLCNGELMSYSNIQLLANGHYRIYGLKRGIYDTVPKGHVAYDIVYFLDYALNIKSSGPVAMSGYTAHESLEITTASSTTAQEFDITKIESFDTHRRTESPSIMGNLQFSADRGDFSEYDYNFPASTVFCHDIHFKFKARNKFNDSSIKWQGADSVEVPATRKNYIKWRIDTEEYEVMYDGYDQDQDPATLEDMTFKWADFCEKMGSRVRANNELYMEIGTYDPDKELYSYDHYEKQIHMLPPILVGIVENDSDVQALADSIVHDTVIEIPDTPNVCSAFSLSYDRAALIFIGELDDNGKFMSLDGNKYNLSTRAFRIDGATETSENSDVYTASVHEVTIDNNYIFRTNYTGVGVDPKYYKCGYNTYNEYTVYVPPI